MCLLSLRLVKADMSTLQLACNMLVCLLHLHWLVQHGIYTAVTLCTEAIALFSSLAILQHFTFLQGGSLDVRIPFRFLDTAKYFVHIEEVTDDKWLKRHRIRPGQQLLHIQLCPFDIGYFCTVKFHFDFNEGCCQYPAAGMTLNTEGMQLRSCLYTA